MKTILNGLKKKLLNPIINALRNGMSQKRLAISLALGITLGLIPFYGVTTVLVGVVAVGLRLDFVVMQAIHYIIHPIQIALIIPFFKAGNFVFNSTTIDFTIREYLAHLKADFWNAISDLWVLNLSAVGVWFLISIPISYLLYKAFFYTIRRYAPALIRKPGGIA